ncbi:MAG TPA: hypothetical protein DCS55_08805, partial [Acidimicrobiaceae bacterium]|nr:hypothetical protein [Acidimicrobiaceae bacterium]
EGSTTTAPFATASTTTTTTTTTATRLRPLIEFVAAGVTAAIVTYATCVYYSASLSDAEESSR